MIHWMLQRMEHEPSATFTEVELNGRGPGEFERLRRERLIRRSVSVAVGRSFVASSGRLLTVTADPAGVLECIDEDEVAFDPVPYTGQDVPWQLDIDAVARRIREINRLGGPQGWLIERLYLLGERAPDRAIILGLFPDGRSGMALLKGLPGLVLSSYTEFLLVCPSFVLNTSDIKSLELRGISTATLDASEPFLLPTWRRHRRDGGAEGGDRFDHSDDYRWLRIDEFAFSLTTTQAAVARILHEAWLSGRPDVSWAHITMRLTGKTGADDERLGPSKMSDVFKASRTGRSL